MPGSFGPEPPELRAYRDAVALREAVLRRLGELDVDNAVNRINASEAPIEARDKLYGHRLRLIDMMTSLAREKGVQSLYGELTPSIREELGQIQKIEVEAGTAPPEPEPAIAVPPRVMPRPHATTPPEPEAAPAAATLPEPEKAKVKTKQVRTEVATKERQSKSATRRRAAIALHKEGKTPKEIGGELGISPITVRGYVRDWERDTKTLISSKAAKPGKR